jgi:RNA polymerase sigma-70 factor, ECF subfamily
MADRGRQYLILADEDLMALVEGGDPGAFAGLYDRHGRAAYSLAYRMAGERQAAEDLVQDAFLDVWRAAGSYKAERGSVRTWVLSIVHNRGIDQLRSAASRRRILELAYFSGYTHTEIADLLDLPLGTVKGRMRLGLKKIRAYFDARGMVVPG